jgi:hypothetical protein
VLRYSLSTLLCSVLIAAIALSWFVDHRRLASKCDELSRQLGVQMKRNLIAAESIEARRAKVLELTTGSDPSDVPLLLYALTDPDYQVRSAALDGLTRIRTDAHQRPSKGSAVDRESEDELLFWVDAVNHVRKNNAKRSKDSIAPQTNRERHDSDRPLLDAPFGGSWPIADLDEQPGAREAAAASWMMVGSLAPPA